MNQIHALPYRSGSPQRLSQGYISGQRLFHNCCRLYLVAFFLLPDGFGFRLGFLFSAKRIMLFLCYGGIIFDKERLTAFWKDIKSCVVPNILIFLDLFVRFYTAVYRLDPYTIYAEVLDGVLVFYLFLYIFKHEITAEQLLEFIRVALVILCIEGFWEAITHINLFGLLNFAEVEGLGQYATRGGASRVCGPCHHSIHFGIYLTILFFLSCVDVKRNRLYLFRSPLLFILVTICIFLTGSRAPQGVYLLGIALICLFSNKDERILSILILMTGVSVFAIIVMLFYRTEFGRQVMYMLTAMLDVVLGTEYSLNYTSDILRWSTETREALAKVFNVWYFNKFVGRGCSYQLSVIIDGYWVRSCDNAYVGMFIYLAYPGLAVFVGHALIMLGACIKGMWKKRQRLFNAALIVVVCYFINVWFVPLMGTYMYIWMLMALIYAILKNEKEKELTDGIKIDTK